MEAAWTRKAYTSAVVTAVLICLFVFLMYWILGATVSCVSRDGCLKSWCNEDWFPGGFIDSLDTQRCARGGGK